MKWEKKGHIFKPKDKQFTWSNSYAQIPRPLVLKDRLRIYYATRFFDDNNSPISQTSFIDVDLEDLSKILYVHNKPSLALGYEKSFSEYGIHPTMLISKQNFTYFFYQGWQRGTKYPYITEIGLAKSFDEGLNFSKLGEKPIFGKSKNDPYYVNGVFIILKEDKYYMFYSSGKKWVKELDKFESVYQIKCAVSSDLINWSTDNDFCIQPKFENECQNSASVIYFNNMYHMWFCYRPALNFRNLNRGYRIGYAYSSDMLEWIRDDSKAGIDVSKEDTWDSEMICYPYVLKINDKIIMLYSGNYFGKSGFGYAELKIK